MILGAYGKDSLCEVLCRTKMSKGVWKEFQSGSLSWRGDPPKKSVARDFYHIFTHDGHVVHLLTINLEYLPNFDHLLPELELSISVPFVSNVAKLHTDRVGWFACFRLVAPPTGQSYVQRTSF